MCGGNVRLDESQFVDTFPFPVTLEVLEHGRDRYMIYCVVCHDPLGTGRGKIVERGYTPPPSYHIPRLRSVPVGHLFAVISEGYGSMPSYAGQISPRDRWAIVAYVRALQLSQHFPADQLTPEMKKEMASRRPARRVAVSIIRSSNGAGRLIVRWERGALAAGCVAWCVCVLGAVCWAVPPSSFARTWPRTHSAWESRWAGWRS